MKRLAVLILVGILMILGALYLGSSSSGSIVWEISGGGKLLLPLIIVAALVDSINPCAISVLLLTIAFLFSLGRLRSGIVTTGLAYIFGLFVVYLLIGLGILQALSFFGVPHFMANAGAILLVVLGVISLTGLFYPSFPIRLGIPHSAHKKMAELMNKGSIPTAFLLGGFVGLCEFPCTGGPYLTALGLLHDSQTYWSGFGYLLLYNLIFVLPLLILLFIASDKVVLTKVQGWKRNNNRGLKLWGGIAMILLGAFILLV